MHNFSHNYSYFSPLHRHLPRSPYGQIFGSDSEFAAYVQTHHPGGDGVRSSAYLGPRESRQLLHENATKLQRFAGGRLSSPTHESCWARRYHLLAPSDNGSSVLYYISHVEDTESPQSLVPTVIIVLAHYNLNPGDRVNDRMANTLIEFRARAGGTWKPRPESAEMARSGLGNEENDYGAEALESGIMTGQTNGDGR